MFYGEHTKRIPQESKPHVPAFGTKTSFLMLGASVFTQDPEGKG